VSAPEIEHAARILRAGGLVVFPTETVYGLGADAANADAVARVYAVKGRPSDHPIIVHLASADALDDYAHEANDATRALARACWPGPLTLVVRRRPGTIADAVTGGRDTVALRVPAHPVAHALLAAFGGGVAAPSANRFGRVSPTTAAHVRADLDGDVDAILDGGAATVGVESTIVDCTGAQPAILRLGGVTRAEVEAVLGHPVVLKTRGEVAAPGTLERHYSPAARVLVVGAGTATAVARREVASGHRVGLLALAGVTSATSDDIVVLRPPRDVDDYARVLYARLREADDRGLDTLVVVPPPTDGIGAAVGDRLTRAAATTGLA
jgi:L-threonylcarbamoyladenylate synthase